MNRSVSQPLPIAPAATQVVAQIQGLIEDRSRLLMARLTRDGSEIATPVLLGVVTVFLGLFASIWLAAAATCALTRVLPLDLAIAAVGGLLALGASFTALLALWKWRGIAPREDSVV